MFPCDGISPRMSLSASPFSSLICEFKRWNPTCWTQHLLDFSFSGWACPPNLCNPMAPLPCGKGSVSRAEMACGCQTIPVNKEKSFLNSVIMADLNPPSPISFNSNKSGGLTSICLSLLSSKWFWIQMGKRDVIYWLAKTPNICFSYQM